MKRLDEIKKLVNLEKSIQEIYLELIRLESEHKKNTQEFNDLINLLKATLKIEDKYIESVKDYIIETMDNFSNNTFRYVVEELANDNIFSKAEQVEDNIIYQRIINKIYLKQMEEQLPEGRRNKEDEYRAIIKTNMIIEKVYHRIKELEKIIEDEEYKDIREDLIYNKYSNIFFSYEAEQTLFQETKPNRKKRLLNYYYEPGLISFIYNQEITSSINLSYSNILTNITDENIKAFKEDCRIYMVLEEIEILAALDLIDNTDELIKTKNQLIELLQSNAHKELKEQSSTAIKHLQKILKSQKSV